MRSARSLVLGLVLASLVALPGCGYRRALPPPPGASSVGVAFFLNETPERDLERELALELAAAVRDLVQAPLEDPSRADVVVTGRLTDYRRRGGIRDPQNRLLESGVSVLVEAWLADGRTGAPLTSKVIVTSSIGYLIPEPGGELQARSRGLRHLADRIVLDLFQPTAPPPLPPTGS